MAGATNRALKAAGVPKASIKTIRVKAGGRLSLKSALGVAAEHGLDTGKAHEHLARRDAKTEAKAAEGRKVAMLAAGARRQQGVTRALGAASSGMLAARKAAAERARAEAQRPTPATGDIRAKVRAAREANRTAMSGYGKMPAPMLNQARQTISDARATMRAAGPAPAGKAHVILNGSVAAVAPTKRAGHFFAYEQGGKSHVAHDATGASIGTYSSQATAHKALDGMRKTGDRLNAGLLRGDEKAIRLGARFQRATQRETAPSAASPVASRPRPDVNAHLNAFKAAVATKTAPARPMSKARQAMNERLSAAATRNAKSISESRAAISSAAAPKKGYANVVGGPDGALSARPVKVLNQRGDMFVHATPGGYAVSHKGTGTMVYSGPHRDVARAVMEGMHKSGGRVMDRIGQGDTRALAALGRFRSMARGRKYVSAALNKYNPMPNF